MLLLLLLLLPLLLLLLVGRVEYVAPARRGGREYAQVTQGLQCSGRI